MDGQDAEFDGTGRDGILIGEKTTQLPYSFCPDI